MSTALVTGGAGFLGSHLVEALLAQGRRVIALDDLSTGIAANLAHLQTHPRFRFVQGDVTREECLAPLLAEADEVYHLAAVVGVRLVLEQPERTVTTNLGSVELLLRLLSRQPRRLFLASTSEVYGKNPKMPLAEDDDLLLGPTTRSRWVYACSKALDEYLALAQHQRTGLPVVIGRLFNTVGPRQLGRHGMVLPRFVDQALAGQPLEVHGDGAQVRCFAHVADVVGAIVQLMQCPAAAGKVFNLGSDAPVSIASLAQAVIALANPQASILHTPYEQVFTPGFEDIRCRIPDLTRVRELIQYRPRHTLDDVIRDVVAWRRTCRD